MTMRSCRLVLCVLLGFTLAPSTEAVAQEVTVSGVVVDESKGVLPGVTVMATSVGTGRQFAAVTNERGEYRLVG